MNLEKAIEKIKEFKFLQIGTKVKTKDGEGVIVSTTMPYNGLYIEPERARYTVWYGPESGCGWGSFLYAHDEVETIN